MPEGLDPKYWDATGGKLNDVALIKDFSELSGFKKTFDESRAALPKDPAGYKLELKLPEGFKAPEGYTPKIDEKDPRIPMLQAFAVKHQMSPEAVNELAALDVVATAQMYEQFDKAEKARVEAEKAKLGDKADVRMAAVDTFLKTLGDEKHAALQGIMTDSVAFQAIEDLIARANGTAIPGAGGGDPPKPHNAQPIHDRWYGNNQQKAV